MDTHTHTHTQSILGDRHAHELGRPASPAAIVRAWRDTPAALDGIALADLTDAGVDLRGVTLVDLRDAGVDLTGLVAAAGRVC